LKEFISIDARVYRCHTDFLQLHFEMKSSHQILFLLLASLASSNAQDNAPNPESDFFEEGDPSIDFPGCFSDLIVADVNGDGVVKSSEYLGFIQEYGKRKCIENPVLTWQQRIAFNNIACQCRSELGAGSDCCLGDKAQIRTDGALNPARTGEQNAYLTSACRITDATLPPYACPPKDDTREAAPLPPLPPVFLPPAPSVAGDDGGLPKEALWAIIAAAVLLLLLCCCACVARKRKGVEEEEVVEEEILGKGSPGEVDEEAPPVQPEPEQYVPVAPLAAAAAAPMAREPEIEIEEMVEEESEDEDEEGGRKRTGGGPLGQEEEEGGVKRYGAGRFPPPEKEAPELKLRPIEKESEEDPDWDHPGRPIEEPKTKTEDEGQVFDPYIPDGGVYIPERPKKGPVEYDPQWERAEKEDPDDVDKRKHRIQSGLGEAAVWDQLDNDEGDGNTGTAGGANPFDWVIQSALGVLDKTDDKYTTSNTKGEPKTET
jgi:hypothetical protein